MPSATQQRRKPKVEAAREPPPSEATAPVPRCVACLVRSGRNVNGNSIDDGDVSIHTELRKGPASCVGALLEAGANVCCRRGGSEPSIHLAARLGDTKRPEPLIAAAADVNRHSDDWYAIHAAVRGRHPERIRLLARAGASVDVRDDDSLMPLDSAARRGYADCVAALLEVGADMNERGPFGKTVMHVAARLRRVDCMALLIQAGADVNARDDRGLAPLADAILLNWVPGDLIECIKMLIAAGADIDATDDEGKTALFHAVDVEVVQVLLHGNANANHVAIDGATVMTEADAATLRLLRKSGGCGGDRSFESAR